MLRSPEGILARFTRDLTADARAGRLDPIRARADEIARVIDILLRHGKNNPALVGPAGVGKTAIVEGLAQRVATGSVPLALRDIRVLALDHVSLLAGTTYRGQYEERLRAIVAETTSSHDVVLFIDELHNLIGQGTALGVAMDAGNMLKPALVRGDFRVIGATTDDEYLRWVCGDPALERRFQKVTVRELGIDETLDILRARRDVLERHHGVVIADEAIDASVRLTDVFQSDRMRPDRAIDALDEACAHTHAVTQYSPRAVALLAERRRASGARPYSAPRPAEAHSDGDPDPEDPLDPNAPLGRFARDGFAALERFGAELEAMFAVQPEPMATGAAPAARPATAPEYAAAPSIARTAAELDIEIRLLLAEEGVVVRGTDVARVVAAGSGREVQWPL